MRTNCFRTVGPFLMRLQFADHGITMKYEYGEGRLVMKRKVLIALTLCMIGLTACGTKENVKPDPATEQVTKAEPTETVQAETETQEQEVKKPEVSNTRVIKMIRGRAIETANDDGTFDYKIYLQGKDRHKNEEYEVAYEVDNMPLRMEGTDYFGEMNSTGVLETGGYIGLMFINMNVDEQFIDSVFDQKDLDKITRNDILDDQGWLGTGDESKLVSFDIVENTDDFIKIYYVCKDGDCPYVNYMIQDKKTGEKYLICYSMFGTWSKEDSDKQVKNFVDTVKLIPFDESAFEEGK